MAEELTDVKVIINKIKMLPLNNYQFSQKIGNTENKNQRGCAKLSNFYGKLDNLMEKNRGVLVGQTLTKGNIE